MKTFILATKNKGKIIELQTALKGLNVRILSLSDYPNCPDAIENGITFYENAVAKAIFYSKYTQLPCLADDSGLEVEVLNGKPGIKSARYAGEAATDTDNNIKLISTLKLIQNSDYKARYCCSLAYAENGELKVATDGYCDGKIVLVPKGTNGFGYDPYFFIDSLQKTAAEATIEEKELISHRGKALRKWREWFISQI